MIEEEIREWASRYAVSMMINYPQSYGRGNIELGTRIKLGRLAGTYLVDYTRNGKKEGFIRVVKNDHPDYGPSVDFATKGVDF